MSNPSADVLAVSFEQVTKRFGARLVLDALDLAVRRGESFGLVGVNGAGKTTCLKSMLDFCPFDSGRILLHGVPSRTPRARSRLAYLPERFLPPYFLTGGEFLDYMNRLYGVSPGRGRIEALFAELDLDTEALARPVRTFSKGMAQKLGLAACFLAEREMLVLDEPMSGLDPKARLLVKRHLAALRAEGRTLFFSTHMLADVDELCDRMGVLHEARVRFVGTPDECRERFAAPDLEQAYLHCIS